MQDEEERGEDRYFMICMNAVTSHFSLCASNKSPAL